MIGLSRHLLADLKQKFEEFGAPVHNNDCRAWLARRQPLLHEADQFDVVECGLRNANFIIVAKKSGERRNGHRCREKVSLAAFTFERAELGDDFGKRVSIANGVLISVLGFFATVFCCCLTVDYTAYRESETAL